MLIGDARSVALHCLIRFGWGRGGWFVGEGFDCVVDASSGASAEAPNQVPLTYPPLRPDEAKPFNCKGLDNRNTQTRPRLVSSPQPPKNRLLAEGWPEVCFKAAAAIPTQVPGPTLPA